MQRRQHDLPALLAALAPVVYPVLRERYRHDCCIAAAAILTRVFAEFGFKAEPVPVTVEIYNAAMCRLLRDKVKFPADKAQRELFFDLTGAWAVGIMPPGAAPQALRDQRGGGYGGHLLLRVEDYLIDATIKQAERPEKKIVLPDMLGVEGAASLEREGWLPIEVGESTLVYRRIHDHSYTTAPDWKRRTTPFPESVRGILQRVRKEAAI